MSFNELPEGCIANILSFTSPEDAGRLSVVSPTFRSASESDVVWEQFLPDDHHSIISNSNSFWLLQTVTSKKQLYLSLCDNPIVFDNGRKSFSLEKRTGKIRYMLSARELWITHGGNPQYWTWNSNPASRFPEVAELIQVCWLEIKAGISTCVLSPSTLYTAYLVFSLFADGYGLDDQPVEVEMKLDGVESSLRTVGWSRGSSSRGRREVSFYDWAHTISASSEAREEHCSKERADGWFEIEMGDFFSKELGEKEELEIRVFDFANHWKCGLIVEGIEFRQKMG